MTEALIVDLEHYIQEHGATSGGSWSSGEPMITVRVSALRMMIAEIRRCWARVDELQQGHDVLYKEHVELQNLMRAMTQAVQELAAAVKMFHVDSARADGESK